MSGCLISDREAPFLAAALIKAPQLELLDVSNNPIGDDGAVAFAAAAKQRLNGHMLLVDLRKCKIGERGGSQFAEKFSLTTFNLLWNPIGPKALKLLAACAGETPNSYCAHAEDIHICCLGAGGIGAKTSMIIRFVQNHFVGAYDPTIEDSYRKQFSVDGITVSAEILDTPGQEEYSTMRDLWMRTNEVFSLGFSITERRSFEEVMVFYKQLQCVKDTKGAPMLLVGAKLDLEQQRQVPSCEALALAKKLNCQYLEVSARTGENVDVVFLELAHLVIAERVKTMSTVLPHTNKKILKLSTTSPLPHLKCPPPHSVDGDQDSDLMDWSHMTFDIGSRPQYPPPHPTKPHGHE
eukprot:TRINITY_DN13475_c0_g1_i1.p1 TRINITY_DN13475_c0_g1~~TRINITY_DN13475_c0_g1_i1.p1  ORF type:complete len:351 (-),score=56.57 TRINITY_DN13475_c0_g1_i1:76-1128(-)